MKRRDFIQKTAACSAFLALPSWPLLTANPSDVKQITILHTNDVHSHIDSFPLDDPRNPGMGGVSRRATLIESIRKENPNVVRLYKKYEKQGFTVLSVSLDEDPNAWKAAIAKDGLIWKNHVSDLKGWESSMPALYGFEGIPFTVLVNKEGNIIGKELRGEVLERKLSEIFKN
jgi:hypothetical protein